ncbi:MAG: DUF5667 domain-containing protein [Chloroflexota bacterium]|nr:DUF5667 domain-containing protein [Chloroflexota bacterium]
MSEFETRLDECLEALREGRWDIDECLRRYPQHAAELRPHLLAAAAVVHAFSIEPSEEYAQQARERFLIASGQRLREAFDVEPEPTFFASARLRFLLAAQRIGLGERQKTRRLIPAFHAGYRALAGSAAALVLLLSFSTYTVASATSALPGDWQYPVKLQTERVRLALAFSDSSKLDVRLSIAEERAHELEQLTKQGRIIGPGVLDRIVEQTQPLVDGASADGDWDTGDVSRLKSLAEREQQALQNAASQIDPTAQDSLVQATDVTRQAADVAGKILVTRPDAPPLVIKGTVPLTVTFVTEPPASTTPGPSATPDAATPGAPTATVAAPTPAAPGEITVGATPVITRGGMTWNRLAVGRFTTLIPSEQDGWHIVGIALAGGPSPAPSLVKLSDADGTSLVTLNPRTGDMYWFVAHGGRFDEIQMRLEQPDGGTLVQDPDSLLGLYGDAAKVPLYILDHIAIEPAPTRTPEPTSIATVVVP